MKSSCAISGCALPRFLEGHHCWRGFPSLNNGPSKKEEERRMLCVITPWLQTRPLPQCQYGGHLGVSSDILSNCIILLSMLTGYVIFHRSVRIIRAWLSQRDPPDVCDLLQLDLVFPSKPCQIGLARTFQEHFNENTLERISLIQLLQPLQKGNQTVNGVVDQSNLFCMWQLWQKYMTK